jgi:hypothetical protein
MGLTLMTGAIASAVAAAPQGSPLAPHARLDFRSVPGAVTDGVQPPESLPEPKPPVPFGQRDSWRWSVTLGGAVDLEESNWFVLAGAGLSWFMIDNLSLDMELNLLYIAQTANDAGGLNFTLLARWHFLARERWSLYLDGGAGMMGTTERVPGPNSADSRGGGNFMFTPQAGGGFSVQVDERARLLAGVRWYHISNARTRSNNPPRDSLYFYAGLSLPF